MVDYYAKVAPAIVPHLSGRAVTLRRFPEGIEDLDAAFYEKRCPKHRPKWVKTAKVQAGAPGGGVGVFVFGNPPPPVLVGPPGAVGVHPPLSEEPGAET